MRVWIKMLRGCSIPEVRHLVYFVGETIPSWFGREADGLPVIAISCEEPPGKSIAHYHNLGAKRSSTEWIMKMDVDCLAHVRFFRELANKLKDARPREWFNVGMLMINRPTSDAFLSESRMPLSEMSYTRITLNPRASCVSSYAQPEATNFVCRRIEYLQLGGADERFHQYGWEDYGQIYMLERHQQGKDPLPGVVNGGNVTQRCRDEISRPKAHVLYALNRWLCLLHRWHPTNANPLYKSPEIFTHNREVLLDYITKLKTAPRA